MPTSPAPEGRELPREVGGFRLRRELGRGGMGVVYEAEELGSGRRLALKVLLADLAVSPEAYERFQREAKLAAAISHAQCVFVYGAHQIDGAPAIAMEIVDGETLEQKIARKETIPVETAVRWTIDLIDGLEAAHRAGVLHRDMKPSNCFVTPEGRVKVGDFGLSRTLEQDAQLTRTGQFLGSPLYASPEQVRGRAIDERSDMYSCAATLYALLAGRAPYSGSNVGEVLARILSEPPDSLRGIRPAVPAGLESAVLRAMQRDPDDRYEDLGAFREALAPFATTSLANASPWRRVLAYFVDSMALSAVNMGLLVVHGALGFQFLAESNQPNSWPALTFKLLTTLVFAAYFALLEGRFATSLGKWLLGLRVVSGTTRERTIRGAGLRALVFMGPGLLLQVAIFLVATTPEQIGLITMLGTVLLPPLMFSTARRSNGWRGVHEFLSGTIVKPVPVPFRRTRPELPPPETSLTPLVEGPITVGHYSVEGVVGHTPRGSVWKAHDSRLERSVWIHVPRDPVALADEARRSTLRATRLRWIGSVATPQGMGDVFESPGGTSLSTLSTSGRQLEWWRSEQMLAALVAELRNEPPERRYSAEQVWIDRDWNVRLLDDPVISDEEPVPMTAMELVESTSRALFRDDTSGAALPQDLPLHAEPAVARLLGEGPAFEDLASVARALDETERGPATLPKRIRVAQLSVSSVFPTGFVAFLVFVIVVLAPFLRGATESFELFHQLARDVRARAEKNPVAILTDEERDVREILVARALQDLASRSVRLKMEGEDEELVKRILANHPNPSEEEVAQARAQLARSPAPEVGSTTFVVASDPTAVAVVFSLGVSSLWGLFALPFAFFLRGGLTLTVFGVCLRDRRGRRAGRLRCLTRAMIAWTPVLGCTIFAMWLVTNDRESAALLVLLSGLAAWGAALTYALMNPEQSIVDRLLGTRLVPR